MKVTFELPPPVVHQLRALIPSGDRSKFVADLLARNLRGKATALEKAALKANTLTTVSREMKGWEALNEMQNERARS